MVLNEYYLLRFLKMEYHLLLFLILLLSCNDDPKIEPDDDNTITIDVCKNDILSKEEIFRPLSQFFNERTWYFYRSSDFFTVQDGFSEGLTFNSTNYAKRTGGTNGLWNKFYLSQSDNKLTLENYSSLVTPDVFDIIDLDSNRLVLFNPKICADTCYLVSSNVRSLLLSSICEGKDCSDNHINCEDGRCVCDFGFLGENCQSTYKVYEQPFDFTLSNVLGVFENYWVVDVDRDAADNLLMAITSSGDVLWQLEHKFNFFSIPFSQGNNEDICFIENKKLYIIDTKTGLLTSSSLSEFGTDYNLNEVNITDDAILVSSRIGFNNVLLCLNKNGTELWRKDFPLGYISHAGVIGGNFIVRTLNKEFIIYDINGNILLQKVDNHTDSYFENAITYFDDGILLIDSGIVYRYGTDVDLKWTSNYLSTLYGLKFKDFRVQTFNQTIYIVLSNRILVMDDITGNITNSYQFDDSHLPYSLNPLAFSMIDENTIDLFGMPSNTKSDFMSFIKLQHSDLFERIPRCPF